MLSQFIVVCFEKRIPKYLAIRQCAWAIILKFGIQMVNHDMAVNYFEEKSNILNMNLLIVKLLNINIITLHSHWSEPSLT